MARPPDAERGGSRSPSDARAGGQPPPGGDEDLFTDEELAWEEDGVERPRDEGPSGWPIPRRRGGAERPTPYQRRRLIAAGALVALVAVVGIALGLTLGGGGGSTATTSIPTAPLTTQASQTTTTVPATVFKVTVTAGKPLKQGSSGAQVRTLQRALKQLGFSVGKIDGVFGPTTQAAVIAFQKQQNLNPDGVVGPKTAAALNSALAP